MDTLQKPLPSDFIVDMGGILPRPEMTFAYELNNIKAEKDLVQPALLELAYIALKETAEAIQNCEYTKFDALVKNFGCQITMLEVVKLSKTPTLREQADKLKAAAEAKLKSLKQLVQPDKNRAQKLASFCLESNNELSTISKEIVRLTRLRLLCIINDNDEFNNEENGKAREKPCTKIDPLLKKLSKTTRRTIQGIISPMIEQLQIEESVLAATFIRQEAPYITDERGQFLQRMLRSDCERRASIKVKSSNNRAVEEGIASVPLLYNTEVSIARLDGILLVKNKLKICKKPIDGALDIQVLLKMPECRTLTADVIAAIEPDEPISVIEGYVNSTITDPKQLADMLQQYGLMNIIKINCASIQQYASGASQKPLADATANEEIESLKTQKALQDATLEIDHIYCASAKEVLRK